MSHFIIGVILPKNLIPQLDDKDYSQVDKAITDLLAPYDENIVVEPYERECWCINMIARKEARTHAEQAIGLTMQDIRDAHWADPEVKEIQELLYKEELPKAEAKELAQRKDELWKGRTKPYFDALQEALEKHPLKDQPDSTCSECKGTGTHESTYNPKSKWDWYRVGGRWDGWIQGTVRESADRGFNFSVQHEHVHNNIIKVSKFIEMVKSSDDNENNPDGPPFAIVTPKGEWCQRGEMGWWAVVTDENEDWDTTGMNILADYHEHYMVGVDCHI